MRQSDMPPPTPERVANPRIREDRAVQNFQFNSEKMHRATFEDAYTRAWFEYCRSVFTQSVRKAGPNVDLYNVSTNQCSILFNNMGSFNQKSEFRKSENMGNNCAHVILTAEADSLPTDEKELLDNYGLVGCLSSRSNDLSVHARINSSRKNRLLWESDDDRNGHAAIFEVKFGKKTERTTTESREQSAEQLCDTLVPVALAVKAASSVTTEAPFEPTARCITDTKKRQLVTQSGLPRLRCCVCHLHHKLAMISPATVRQFFKTVLQQMCRFKVDVIEGDANAAAYKYYKNQ